jgi:RimJ/RimL family protein N-acetyltransferase
VHVVEGEAANFEAWQARIAAQARAPQRRTYRLAIEHQGAHAGQIRLDVDDLQGVELGYVLRRDLWNKGLVPEAAALALGFVFDELGHERAWATAASKNAASLRVMEKLGMRREGLLLRHVFADGEWRDSVLCAITKREWEVLRAFPAEAREATQLGLSIARAAPRDIETLFALMEIVGEDLRARFGMDHWRAWPADHLAHDAARRETYVVKDGDEIVGSFTIGFDPVWFNETFLPWAPAKRPTYLNRLMTHPKYQSSGIGALMMRTAEQLARARGCDFLRLETRTDFEAVRRFYDRLGYALRYEDQKDPWCALDKAL